MKWFLAILTILSSAFVAAANGLTSSYQVVSNNLTTDLAITAAVQKALANDGNTAQYANSIYVTTLNGVVTLSGIVYTETAKYQIGLVAKGVVGDNNVINNIYVKQ